MIKLFVAECVLEIQQWHRTRTLPQLSTSKGSSVNRALCRTALPLRRLEDDKVVRCRVRFGDSTVAQDENAAPVINLERVISESGPVSNGPAPPSPGR